MAKGRSPSYPGVPLNTAIELTRDLYEEEHLTVVQPEVAVQAWGHEKMTGPAGRKLAALRYYGLVEDLEGGVRVSKLAEGILHPRSDDERDKFIQEAALNPKIFQEIYEDFARASDTAITSHLVRDRNFNSAGADRFVDVFRETISFASLDPESTEERHREGGGDEAAADTIDVGDYVQWESQGALQFSTPKRVTGFSRDGNMVFVEGEKTAFPRDQVEKAEPPAEQPPPTKKTGAGGRQKRAEEMVGAEETIRDWTIPLPGKRFAVLSAPDALTKKDHDMLLKYLELMEDALVDEGGDESGEGDDAE